MEDQSFYDLKDCLDSKDFESCSIEELEFNFSEEIGLSLNEEQNDRQSKNQQRKKKANQKIIEKKKDTQRIDSKARSIWTDFKAEIFGNLAASNEGYGHSFENQLNLFHQTSLYLINMKRYDNDTIDCEELPLFKQFFDENYGSKQIKHFDYKTFVSYEDNSELKKIYEEIINDLEEVEFGGTNYKQTCLKNTKTDLIKLKQKIISWIKFLQSHVGQEPKNLPSAKIDIKREAADFKLLFAKAAFNELILNSYQSKKWAIRLAWFDQSRWFYNLLTDYLNDRCSRLDNSDKNEEANSQKKAIEMMKELLVNAYRVRTNV